MQIKPKFKVNDRVRWTEPDREYGLIGVITQHECGSHTGWVMYYMINWVGGGRGPVLETSIERADNGLQQLREIWKKTL